MTHENRVRDVNRTVGLTRRRQNSDALDVWDSCNKMMYLLEGDMYGGHPANLREQSIEATKLIGALADLISHNEMLIGYLAALTTEELDSIDWDATK